MLLHGARQVGDQIVVDLLAGIDAAGGGAVLAGIVVAEGLARRRPPTPRSASSKTITGALPPSSRCVRLSVAEAACSTFLPVAMSPVSETMATFGWLISALPVVAPRPVTTLTTPSGKISAMILASFSVGQRRLLGGLDARWCCRRRAPARASRPPSSADSSTARSSRRRRSDRGGSSRCGRPCTRRPPAPCMLRTAPAKKRKQSTIAGISSCSTRMRGLPQLSASSVAKASASFSMASASFSRRRRALGRAWCATRSRNAFVGGVHRGVDLGHGGIGQSDDGLLGLGIEHGFGRFGAGNELRADQHFRVEH